MPSLIGVSVDSARRELASLLGYEDVDSLPLMVLDSFYTDVMPEGTVAWQYPLPDSLIMDSVWIRPAAPMTIKLPDVRGVEFMKAKEIITSLDLGFFAARQVESEKYPAGTIAKTLPAPGSIVKRRDTITILTSMGVFNPTPTKTPEGVELHLYGEPEAKLTSVTLLSQDSLGFDLEFGVAVKNPYEHSITFEGFQLELQVNRARTAAKQAVAGKIATAPKQTVRGKLKIHVPYAGISAAVAKSLLSEAGYRLVGTCAYTVESGFSRKPFEANGDFNLFSRESADLRAVKEKLEDIAVTPPGWED